MTSQRAQEQRRVGQRADRRPAVQAQVAPAAVGRDIARAAPDVPAIVEPEVARHAGQQHHVGLAQRLAALVAQLQRVAGAQQAAGHARKVYGRADLLDRSG